MSDGPARVLYGRLVDIPARRIAPICITVRDGRIAALDSATDDAAGRPEAGYFLPGLIDAHVHIESSMLTPVEFARAAVCHGTVATVSDPHEIGNVLGVEGVRYMLDNAARSPLKIFFGAPSCVPATLYETAGATISAADVAELLDDPRIVYLSEMMNFPGVLAGDPDCLQKIAAAHARGKPVDGHAPGLRGAEAARYLAAGISTDHECFTREEAIDKLAAGCKIAIREGSAARNFEALWTLIDEFPGRTMLCSDDKHPDELLAGHIDVLVRRALERGADLFTTLQAACLTPIEHYGLGLEARRLREGASGNRDVGRLRVGDAADFIEVDSLDRFSVLRTWIDGRLVAERGRTLLPPVEAASINRFQSRQVARDELALPCRKDQRLRVIDAVDGQLITHSSTAEPRRMAGCAVADPERDLLKIVVVNRYCPAPPAVAFIRHMGLREGAMASSVAHDSHNVIGVGADDADLAEAIQAVFNAGGALSAVNGRRRQRLVLPLPIAGLMALGSCEQVAAAYQELDAAVKEWGSTLRAPYMTLSFMALLVIPQLKLSDKGLFDGNAFQWTSPVF